MEVLSQLDIAKDLGYITKEDFKQFEVKSSHVAALLSGLKRYFKKSITQPQPSNQAESD